MKQSLQKYRRLGPVGYAKWAIKANGLDIVETDIDCSSKHTIHAAIAINLFNLNSKPVQEEINPLVQEDAPSPLIVDAVHYDSLTVA